MPRAWRWAAAAVGGVALSFGIALRFGEIRAAGEEFASIPLSGLVALLGATVLQVLVRVWAFTVTVPGMRLRHGYVASEASLAASNGLVGGGVVGAGLKVGMMRSWGIAPDVIAASLLISGVAGTMAMWLVAVAVSSGTLLVGSGSTMEVAVLGVGVAALVVGCTFWACVLWHERATARAVGVVGRVADRVHARWSFVPRVDVAGAVERWRHAGRVLVRSRGVRILGVTLLGNVMLSVVLLVAVRAVGLEGVGAVDAFVALALVRVLSSVAPLPGGVGVTEVGLVALLGHGAVDDTKVIAAVLAFRACTFLLPIATGSICVVLWRRRRAQPGAEPAIAAAAA